MRRFGFRRAVGFALALVLESAPLAAAPAPNAAAGTITLRATYVITIGGIVIGHADAESRFNGQDYAAVIKGSTSGLTRLVSDSTARLIGSGTIVGNRVLPASYALKTVENGFDTRVAMALDRGNITKIDAEPQLRPAPDRVPIRPVHMTGVVDPLGAFLVPLTGTSVPGGAEACDRTVPVFDGWTRFDIALSYKDTKAVDGSAGAYSGPVVVCAARYVPVAGHRAGREAVRAMASNRRLEVWLAPVAGEQLLVPYRILIGTSLGDLVVLATRFSTSTEASDNADN